MIPPCECMYVRKAALPRQRFPTEEIQNKSRYGERGKEKDNAPRAMRNAICNRGNDYNYWKSEESNDTESKEGKSKPVVHEKSA